MGDFNYNAPQYIDFTSPAALELKDFGDEYFDMDHEVEIEYNEITQDNEEQSANTTQNDKSEFVSFEDTSNSNPVADVTLEPENHPNPLRRSVSADHVILRNSTTSTMTKNDDASIIEALESLQLSNTKKKPNKLMNGGFAQNILPSKLQISSAVKARPKSTFKPRSMSRVSSYNDAIHKIGLPSNDVLKRKISVENLQPNKYISLAEAINRFQFGTPQRFHSQSSKTQFNNVKMTSLSHTVPQSPMLATKTRSRSVQYVSRDEQDQIAADEMKRHQIKANAVNYKILRTPCLNKVDKKPNTLPQPFKFAEVKYQKPLPAEPEDVYEFHARPAPKSTAPGAMPISRRSVMPKIAPTVPKKPTRKYVADTLPSVCENSVNNKLNIKTVEMHYVGIAKNIVAQKPVKTKLEPFSFEARDKRMQQRKEEKIKRYLEEEKKAREFHARPILSKVAGSCKQVESKIGKLLSEGSSSSLTSKSDENTEPNSDQKTFRAKPATVIHKKPFIPKKEDRPLLEINEFNLYSNRRAKDRQEFDKKIKEKEEEHVHLKSEYEEIMKQAEMEEVNKLRKEIVHKANPIKHYKPLDILPSLKKVTSPRSPMITKSHRRMNQSTV